MNHTFVGIRNGKFYFELNSGKSKQFDLNDLEGIKLFFAQNNIRGFYCSSSIDFPEEEGAPKNFDAHNILNKALKWKPEYVMISKDDYNKLIIAYRESGKTDIIETFDL